MTDTCTAKVGKVKACVILKTPSRYMIKKYGLFGAQEIYLKKYFRTMGIDYPSMQNLKRK